MIRAGGKRRISSFPTFWGGRGRKIEGKNDVDKCKLNNEYKDGGFFRRKKIIMSNKPSIIIPHQISSEVNPLEVQKLPHNHLSLIFFSLLTLITPNPPEMKKK